MSTLLGCGRRFVHCTRRSFGAVLAIAVVSLAGTPAAAAFEVVDLGPIAATDQVFATDQRPFTTGHGFVDVSLAQPCLAAEQRAAISAELQANRDDLVRRGLLPAAADRSRQIALRWPVVVPAAHVSDPGVHGISAFFDHDPASPGHLLDWNCGQRTYDLPGANHGGTDVFTWPFAWHKMNDDDCEIVAGAAGVIVGKSDGNPDRNCEFGGGEWNAVYIEHADGSVAWYGHMKAGSTIDKSVGEAVAVGEVLGIVGSSGNSSGPHLHLELHDAFGRLVDPYHGPCNPTPSWWLEQPPYYDSAVNALRTHDAPPEFLPCPQPTITHERNQFQPGELTYFFTYYRDQLAGQVTEYEIDRPDGLQWRRWTSVMSSPEHYPAVYWYWSWYLPADALEGYWTFRVTYEGRTVEHRFTVGHPTPVSDAITTAGATVTLHQPYPNPFNPRVVLGYTLTEPTTVDLAIHELRGRRVATLMAGPQAAGEHAAHWTGLDAAGRPVPSGIYWARLVSGVQVQTRRLVLLR